MPADEKLSPFHLAFPVKDLEATREFFCDVIGCTVGRRSDIWIDFNMYGHQLVAHRRSDSEQPGGFCNPVDGEDVPIPHFGLVLDWNDWEELASRLRSRNVEFEIEPHIRFVGQTGEQATMFLRDPSGNALEFKSFKDMSQMFAD